MRQLSIVGSGTNPRKHLTIEGHEEIGRAGAVFLMGITRDELPSTSISESADVFDMMKFYEDGGKDHEHYLAIMQFVIENLSLERVNALVVPGDPRVGVDVTCIFEDIAASYDLAVRCFPGISSASTILHDLQFDLLSAGTCYLDVNRTLENSVPLNAGLNNIFYHVCSIGNAETHFTNPARFNKTEKLVEHLSKYYRADDECILVRSSESDTCSRQVHRRPLSELDALLQFVDFSSTLVIPARRDK